MSEHDFTPKWGRVSSAAVAILCMLAAVFLMGPKPNGLPKVIMLVEDETLLTGHEFKSDVFPTDGATTLTLLGKASERLVVELYFMNRFAGQWNEPGVGAVVGMVCELTSAMSDCRKTAGTDSIRLPSNSIQVGGPYAQLRLTNSTGVDSDFNISVWLQ